MIKYHHLLTFCCLHLYTVLIQAQSVSMDQWLQLSHPYSSAQLQQSTNNIWWSSPSSLISFDPESHSFNYFNKSSYLSDAGIQYFTIHPLNKIIVIYQSGRIDIIDDNGTTTVYDWETNSLFTDKTVKHISFAGELVYITTNSYLIVLDIINAVYKESIPLDQQDYSSSFHFQNKIFVTAPYIISSVPSVSAQVYNHPYLYTISGTKQILLYDSVSIASFNWGPIDTIYRVLDGKIIQCHSVNDAFYFLVQHNNNYKIIHIDGNNEINEELYAFHTTDIVIDFLLHKQQWFILTDNNLLIHQSGNVKQFNLLYPHSYPAVNMAVRSQEIILTDSNSLYAVDFNNHWRSLPSKPVASILADELQTVVLFKDDSLRMYSENNIRGVKYPFADKIIAAAIGADKKIYILTDAAGSNLWVLTEHNEWQYYTISVPDLHHITAYHVDQHQNQWISISGNGIWMYHHNNTAAGNDDMIKHFNTSSAVYTVHNNNALTIQSDKAGILWIGTEDGIAFLPCSQNIQNENSCSFTAPVVSINNSGYRLLAGEKIKDIAVDAANRKWIATDNGLFLIDASATEVIHYYNKRNSDLLSNKISSVEIDHKNGFVVCNTDYGISMIKQSAESLLSQSVNAFVYPNPVSISSNSYVAIRKIPENAAVRILTINGQFVKTLKATGSQLVWYFKDDKITTGVYIAVIIDERTKRSYQTKIFFTP